MFSWNSLAFSMIQWMVEIWSLIPLPFLNPDWTSGSSWFMQCWSLACKLLSMMLLAWEISATVWWFEQSSVLPFLGIGMRIDLFQSCGRCSIFQICWHIECNTLIALSFSVWIALLEFHCIHYLYWQQCFLRSTWFHTPECLALGDWPHHCSYLVH